MLAVVQDHEDLPLRKNRRNGIQFCLIGQRPNAHAAPEHRSNQPEVGERRELDPEDAIWKARAYFARHLKCQ
jgi:hypothetical protein